MSNKKCVFSRKIAILGRFSVINVSSNVILCCAGRLAIQFVREALRARDSPAARVDGGMRKRAVPPPHDLRAGRRCTPCSRASARVATSGGHLSRWWPKPPKPPRPAEIQGRSPEDLHLRGPLASWLASATSKARGQTGARRRPMRSPLAVAFATPFLRRYPCLHPPAPERG